MEKVYFTAKKHLSQFKLDYCCWFAPVRVGLLLVAYINIVIDLVCVIGIANDGLSPTITKVQDILISDFVNKPIPVLAYAIELGFNVVLLCAVYRRDVTLLRVFLYYTFIAVLMSIMTYSIVLAAVPFHIQLAIIVSILFQTYCILVVRSVIVEWKMENKKYEMPRLVMSSLLKDRETPCIYDPINGKIQEITITEVPKKQEVQITVIGHDDKTKDDKIPETKKVAEVKLDTDVKKDVELKKVTEVKVQIESKENKDEKKKGDKTSEEIRKKEEKKLKEDKKKEEKKMKEEKKKEEKKTKEDKKAEKKNKEENKKNNKEEKEFKEEKESKKEQTNDEKIITSLILKKYKDDKDAETEATTKDLKEISPQTINEQPK